MRTRLVTLALAVGFCFCIAIDLCAQSPIADDQKATVVFDLRLKKIRDGEFVSSIDLDKLLNETPLAMFVSGVPIQETDRIFGAFNLPASIEEASVFAGNAPPEVLPVNLFLRIQMATSEQADGILDMFATNADEVEIDGRTFLQPNDAFTNLLGHRLDETTIEFGTREYILAGTGKELFSDGLMAAWSKVPDHGVRLAVDVEGESEFTTELVAMAKESPDMNAMGSAYLDLIDNSKNLRMGIDFDAANLIEISATCYDSAQSEELRSGLDSVLGMAKIAGKNGSNQGIPDPAVKDVADQILDSLEATADGDTVAIIIPKPGDFNNAIGNLANQAIESMSEPMDMGQMDGDMQFGEGDMQFGEGDMQFGEGDMQFGEGEMQFGEGEMQFGEGEMQFGEGEMQFGEDEMLEEEAFDGEAFDGEAFDGEAFDGEGMEEGELVPAGGGGDSIPFGDDDTNPFGDGG